MSTFTISSDNYINAMSADNPAVMTVPPGSKLVFETKDALDGQILSESQGFDSMNWERVNPATGPVAIEGAEPGDSLKIIIEKIECDSTGVMAAIGGFGALADDISEPSIKVLNILEDRIPFMDGVDLPLRPMIGVIGTAPAAGAVSCGVPDHHGGNLDCKLVAPGNILYLPVFHPGGLLAVGDVHACMGDGEIMGTGVETAAKVHVTVELLKDHRISDPVLETSDTLYSLVSDETLELASVRAIRNIRNQIAEKLSIDNNTAGMLISAIGNLEICQIVDPKLTVRFGIPKGLLLSC